MSKTYLNYFLSLLREKVGWYISSNDMFLLNAKIDNIMRKKNVSNVETLISMIEKSPNAFLWEVIEELAPLNTSFYRNYSFFKGLENVLLPYIMENNVSSKKVKILSIGCSTGQELYSLAISIKNMFPDYKKWNLDLLGIDISSEAILKAQKGYYSGFEIQHGLNAKDIIENFENKGNYWQAKKDLLDMVKFTRSNIYKDDKVRGKYDLILCRNVLSGFELGAQRMILEKILNMQVDEGFLCLGLGEKIPVIDEFYNPSDLECVYRAKYISANNKGSLFKDSDMPTFARPELLNITKKL